MFKEKMMFSFFKRHAPSWNDLPESKKMIVTQKLVKAMAGSRYKVVSGNDEWQREQGITERNSEDQILTAYQRGRMLSLTRNACRNSPTFSGMLKQFDLNAVGTEGGKVIPNFKDLDFAKHFKDNFAKWTREADFFDGLSLNATLKIILKTYILGGDMVILFDDGLVEDSGKLLIYEPDEIGNTTDEALAAHYGEFARQSLGRVYNLNSRMIGAIVSRSQRGETTFDPSKCYFLKRDLNKSMFDSLWLMPRNVFRFAQGRGVTPMSASLATILDLEDLCGFELAAAKKNSLTIAQILQTLNGGQLDEMPSAFGMGTDFESMTDEEVEEAVKAETSALEVKVTLDQAKAAGVVYQVLPENYKMELLDTKHPNANMPEFISFIAGRAAAPFGLTQQFATLQANGSDFKSQLLMSQPAFDECLKFLEQICDWTLYRWVQWATKKGIVDSNRLEDNWMKDISWSWTKAAEIDEQEHLTAVEKKLRNCTGTLRDELGSDWREKLLQIKEEIDFCENNNIPHPSFALKSGGYRPELDNLLNNEE